MVPGEVVVLGERSVYGWVFWVEEGVVPSYSQ